MVEFYILIDKRVVPAADLHAYVRWRMKADTRVAEAYVGSHRISTVFLGVDHNFLGEGPPIVFETMIFCEDEDIDEGLFYQTRCSTWNQAQAMHLQAIATVMAWHANASTMLDRAVGASHPLAPSD